MNLATLTSFTAAAMLPLGGIIEPPDFNSNLALPMGGGGSGFDGANASTRRGYIYYPHLDTRREVQAPSRLEMLRRSRYLTRNVGFAKRCTKGLAYMIGSLTPHGMTSDRDWNELFEAAWRKGPCRANSFDRAGRYNVNSIQPVISGTRLQDGDFAAVLTENQAGGAMCAFYEGHQVGNAITPTAGFNQDQWRDGVRVLADRAIAYRLLNPPDYATFVDVSAQDFILCADYLSVGHQRGVSALHHALTNLLDITEIRSDVKLGIKLGNRIGWYVSEQMETGGGPLGMGGKQRVATNGSGENVLIEDAYKGGKIIKLKPGQDIKQLLDQRPHPNSREFLEDLNRDIAWGIGISPDVLWNIAKLGGASVRYVLADAQVWIEAQQQLLVDQFLSRFVVYFVAKEIAAGRLRQPADPDWYWKFGWQPPQKLTVDVGRDGKLSIDLHQAGLLTLKRWFGSQGFDSTEETRQFVREYAQRIQICEEVGKEFGMVIDPDKVFPPAPGSPVPLPGNIIDPADAGNFGDPEAISQMLVEIRDGISHLRAA